VRCAEFLPPEGSGKPTGGNTGRAPRVDLTATARATAVGGAAGFGRLGAITGPLIGGRLLTAGIAYPWGFYIFAVVAALGALSISMVNRDPAPDEPLPVTEDEADHIGERHHH
jgi:MFS family permease